MATPCPPDPKAGFQRYASERFEAQAEFQRSVTHFQHQVFLRFEALEQRASRLEKGLETLADDTSRRALRSEIEGLRAQVETLQARVADVAAATGLRRPPCRADP